MRKLILASLSVLLMSWGAVAQEAATESGAEAAAPTRAAAPQEITRAVHGSWQIKCVTTEPQQCYLFQLIVDENNTPIMEYSLMPVKDETGQGVKLGATLVTPLNTVLQRGVIMQVDENDPVQQSYSWCAQIGCYARFGITDADISQYRGGNKITTVFFMVRRPDQGIEIPMPLDGFGNAYDELMEIEAEQKAAQ